MKIFYVIREGWNAANQSSAGAPRKPRNGFDSNRLKLVAIVDAEDGAHAIRLSGVIAYNNQTLFAVDSPRSVKGLAAEIRKANQ